uniref:Uncharacterized protein n=1 Tax=Ananas comosus var. bracteatus TaxID=296719 RepID=A0A6V7NY15_ANACO|nr:unnamed protein product [Ananas comosus var. bracteatus]
MCFREAIDTRVGELVSRGANFQCVPLELNSEFAQFHGPKPQTRTADSPFPRVSFFVSSGPPFSLAIARLLGRPGRNPTVEAAPSGMDQRRRAGSPNYGRQTVGGGGFSAPSSPAHRGRRRRTLSSGRPKERRGPATTTTTAAISVSPPRTEAGRRGCRHRPATRRWRSGRVDVPRLR